MARPRTACARRLLGVAVRSPTSSCRASTWAPTMGADVTVLRHRRRRPGAALRGLPALAFSIEPDAAVAAGGGAGPARMGRAGHRPGPAAPQHPQTSTCRPSASRARRHPARPPGRRQRARSGCSSATRTPGRASPAGPRSAGGSTAYFVPCDHPMLRRMGATDFEVVAGGCVAVTPLRYDLLDRSCSPGICFMGSRPGASSCLRLPPPQALTPSSSTSTARSSTTVELIVESFRFATRTVLDQVLAGRGHHRRRREGRSLFRWSSCPIRHRSGALRRSTASTIPPPPRRAESGGYDGVSEYARGLKAADPRLGIVTSKSRDTTQMAFRAVGLVGRFDVGGHGERHHRAQAVTGAACFCV